MRGPEAADRAKEMAERARRSPWFFPAAGLVAIVVAAILVIAVAAGGGEDPATGPSAAPASAPLEQQLDALDRMIEGAAR